MFDPKDLAGFMLEPVKGMANKWQVVMDRPMARGADPLTLGVLLSSAAEAKTTNTKTKVMKNSMVSKGSRKKKFKFHLGEERF